MLPSLSIQSRIVPLCHPTGPPLWPYYLHSSPKIWKPLGKSGSKHLLKCQTNPKLLNCRNIWTRKKKITVERYTHNVAIEKNDEPVEKWGSCSRAEDLGPKSSSCSTAWMGIPIYNHVYIYIHMILYDFIWYTEKKMVRICQVLTADHLRIIKYSANVLWNSWRWKKNRGANEVTRPAPEIADV